MREGERQRTARFRVGRFALQRDGYGDFDFLLYERVKHRIFLFNRAARKVEVIRAVGIIADRTFLSYIGRNGCGVFVNFDAGNAHVFVVVGDRNSKPRAALPCDRQCMNQLITFAEIHVEANGCARAH